MDDALSQFCQAVADDLDMLAVLHHEEPNRNLLDVLRSESFPGGLGLKLHSERGRQAMDLMRNALDSLPDRLEQGIMDDLAADYASIYLNYGIQASPEESVWIDEENLTHQDSMFQVRDWYADQGLAVDNWRLRPDDHLVVQLKFISHLFGQANGEKDVGKAAQFMDEHLLRWIDDFAERVARRCATPYFAGIALLTASYSAELRDLLALIMDEPRPSNEEIENRMNPRKQHEAETVPEKFMPGLGPAV